jgi:hypothetical protein
MIFYSSFLVLSYSFLECRVADGFCIIKHLYSKFVLYRLRAFNGESGNLNQDTMNIMVNGREIANNSYMTCKYSHRF